MPNREVSTIRDEIEATRAGYFKAVGTKPEGDVRVLTNKVKELQAEMSATISNGAEVCSQCENAPLGMEQAGALGGRTISFYEVGCLVCQDRRAQGLTQKEAVDNWNAEKFLPPKKREEL